MKQTPICFIEPTHCSLRPALCLQQAVNMLRSSSPNQRSQRAQRRLGCYVFRRATSADPLRGLTLQPGVGLWGAGQRKAHCHFMALNQQWWKVTLQDRPSRVGEGKLTHGRGVWANVLWAWGWRALRTL